MKPAATLPLDVRLMDGVAAVVFALAALALIAATLLAIARLPWFALAGIRIDGDVARSSVATIRANALPHLNGDFFTIDLDAARAAFESLPWVRGAVVRRVWPNRIAVTLEEHRPAALWDGDDGSNRLVNNEGELFDANLGEIDDAALPRFAGPRGEAARMLALHDRLAPLVGEIDRRVERLELSRRGSWRVQLDSSVWVELGRGSDDEVIERAGRFVHTLAQVHARFERPLEYADLRHADGYAVRLRGITTTAAPAAGRRK